jgi:hypothetical protein
MSRNVRLMLVLVLLLGAQIGTAPRSEAAPAGYRLPFVGQYRISSGPGCYRTHTNLSREAIDFAMIAGTPVIAAQAGEVVFAVNGTAANGYNDGFGNLLKIRHDDGNVSWYAHLDRFTRTSGRVGQGEEVARSGNTGDSSGPHLHFEVRTGGNQPVYVRDLPGISWLSGDPNNPCQPAGYDDGIALGPPPGSTAACPAPILISPSAGQALGDSRVTFSWQALSCGQGYTLRVKDVSSMDSGGTTIFDQGVGEMSRAVELPGQWANRTLYWGVRAANVAGATWAVRSFQIRPTAPGTCSPSAEQVALFEHANYVGRCTTIGVGAYRDPAAMGFEHDSASSVRVGAGVRVTFYEHPDYGGRSESFTGDDPILTDNQIGNDTISSARVEVRGAADPCPAPSLGGPADGAVLADPTLTFTWSPPTGCAFQGYTFRIKDTPTMDQGGTLIVDTGVGGTSYAYAVPQTLQGRDLYWGVRTANPLSPSWAVRRFRVTPPNGGETDPQPISAGQPLEGRIDPASEDDIFTFTGSQGQRATIAMDRTDSSSLDSYLELLGPGGLVGYNDDSGGTLNSRLTVTLPADGAYRVVARSYNRSSAGAYRVSLTLEQTAAGEGDDGRWLRLGEALRGAISPNSDRDTYYFSAAAGRVVSLRMTSVTTGLDSYLELYDPHGAKVAENDDSGGGLNSWIVADLPVAGTYRVVARSWNGASGGDYTVRLEAVSGGNLALGKPAFAAAVEGNQTALAPAAATDGDGATRWSSAFTDNQWIYVDLGSDRSVNQVMLRWERAFADSYAIHVRAAGEDAWRTVYSTASGDGNVDTISFPPTTARYVMMQGRHRYAHGGWQQFGYSLWEFEVYNTLAALVPTVPPDSSAKGPENLVPLVPLPPEPAGKEVGLPSQGTGQENTPAPDTSAGGPAPQVEPGVVYGPPVAGVALSDDRAARGAGRVTLTVLGARDSDEDGEGITAYIWVSSLDGFLGAAPTLTVAADSLSVGLHVITVRVQDNEGSWSEPAEARLEILPPEPAAGDGSTTVFLPLVRR